MSRILVIKRWVLSPSQTLLGTLRKTPTSARERQDVSFGSDLGTYQKSPCDGVSLWIMLHTGKDKDFLKGFFVSNVVCCRELTHRFLNSKMHRLFVRRMTRIQKKKKNLNGNFLDLRIHPLSESDSLSMTGSETMVVHREFFFNFHECIHRVWRASDVLESEPVASAGVVNPNCSFIV